MSPTCCPTNDTACASGAAGALEPRRPQSRGFTLIELMIAMVLGVMVIGGAVQVFAGGRAIHAEMERISALHDNLRFVTDFIARDIRRAGLRADGNIDIDWGLDGTDFPFELRRAGLQGCDGGLHDSDGNVSSRYTLGAGSLRCNTPGASPQALIGNVSEASMCVIHAGDSDCGGSGDPVALRVTLVLQSRAGAAVSEHEVVFTTAMRNAVLARYNSW